MTLSIIGGVALVLVALAGWVGFRALNAKNSLERAQSLVGEIKADATSMNLSAIGPATKKLSAATKDAAQQVNDPIWRVAEYIPVLGKNLTAVRQMADAVDEVATKTVTPVANAAGGISIASLKPVDGKFNLEPLVKLSTALTPAAAHLHTTTQRADAIDLSGTIGQVNDAGVKLKAMLASADSLVSGASDTLKVLPPMLGHDGPRTYLVVFQNLAESTALGGTAASIAEVKVDNGSIAIVGQASSTDFPWRDGNPIIPVDPGVAKIYNDLMYARLNLAPSRPDFPTAAAITQAFWAQYKGENVDGVFSVDPVALSHILGVTGPVKIATGDELASNNVVSLLLNQVYFRYQGKTVYETSALTDPFFGAAAQGIFSSLLTTKANPTALMNAVMQGVREHRVMAWSAHPDEQKVIAGSPLSGILSTTNTEATKVGVFFRDVSASKMDYYMTSAATMKTDVCTAKQPTFTVSVSVNSILELGQVDGLPAYVASARLPGGHFETQVFVYGPPGTTLASSQVDAPGSFSAPMTNGEDLGRPVAAFTTIVGPGETATVTAVFKGKQGTYGAPALQVTPTIRGTKSTIEAPGCVASPNATPTPAPTAKAGK